MAKEKKAKEGGSSRGVGIVLVVLIVITWLSVMALLIKCDVGGFGSSVLRPVFKDVPVIRAILPDASDEEVAKESDYPYDTLEEALAELAEADAANASKDAEIASLNDRVSELETENATISANLEEQQEFEEKKNQFYDEIVYGDSAPDADTYVEWYNQLDSEYAEEVYREIVEAKQADQEILDLASAYESMDAAAAADILESMSNDMDTVALIMNNMSTESQGKILAEMEPAFAASVTKKLLP